MAHADPPDISVVGVIYGYFYFLCLNPCGTQQNHFPLSGYDEILSETQKRRKWIHQRGAGKRGQSAFEGDSPRWGLGRGGDILKCKSPTSVCVGELLEQHSKHMNLSWVLFQVPCTYHLTKHLCSCCPNQSGNGHTGWCHSYFSHYWYNQLKRREISFDLWLQVCSTCNPQAMWSKCGSG